ncbi:MAG: ribbon-helix-helix domain-containing protein [Acetanaerobacterium sp.]
MSGDKLIIKVKPPKGEDGYKIFSIRVKEQSVAQIDVLAQESGRSRNEIIGIFLEYALKNCTIEKGND